MYAHNTEENPLCSRHVWVCPKCGWWKPQAFDCEHLDRFTDDGGQVIVRHAAQRCQFSLYGEVVRKISEAVEALGD